MARIAVIGAGISGLATAEWLADEHELIVLEASASAGGNVQTERVDGVVLERAANGFLDTEPAMEALLQRIGLADKQVRANEGARYVVIGGRLVALPTSIAAFAMSPVLTWGAKLRLMTEPLRGRGPDDESVADFVRRRIGPQALERLVGPMVSGIFAGDPERLSLPACFPKMKAMERDYGSLVIAGLAKATLSKAAAGPAGRLTSIERGIGTLTETLAARRGDGLHTSTPATAIEAQGEGWRVHTADGHQDVDAVVLACPGHVQATLLGSLHPQAASALADIPYASIAVVACALPADGWTPPQGFGALIPRSEGMQVLGTLFTSSIFTGHAPVGTVTLRSMIGGATGSIEGLSHQELAAIARRENEALLGPMPQPSITRVYAHRLGIPQYTVGHPTRLRALRKAEGELRGLFLTGNHLEGIGVKDCARAGLHTAERVGAYIHGTAQ